MSIENIRTLTRAHAHKLSEIYVLKDFKYIVLTAVELDEDTKSVKASITCSRVFVVLNSFEDVPSDFLTPSIRKPKVAVEEMVSLHTMYLKYDKIC